MTTESQKGCLGGTQGVTTIQMPDGDSRRDKRICKYFQRKNHCKWRHEQCIGSSHCPQYEDSKDKKRTLREEKEWEYIGNPPPMDDFSPLFVVRELPKVNMPSGLGPYTDKDETPEDDFKVGMRVCHHRFGEGFVEKIDKENRRIYVKFGFGDKLLTLNRIGTHMFIVPVPPVPTISKPKPKTKPDPTTPKTKPKHKPDSTTPKPKSNPKPNPVPPPVDTGDKVDKQVDSQTPVQSTKATPSYWLWAGSVALAFVAGYIIGKM
ncbi:hypothetical protein [Phascolarctobacterium sp.]|uniref:hypothetical protein n=1 Tax=Phascolarctobacterium sp. TaxID=2049039 RepID=UPI00386D9605